MGFKSTPAAFSTGQLWIQPIDRPRNRGGGGPPYHRFPAPPAQLRSTPMTCQAPLHGRSRWGGQNCSPLGVARCLAAVFLLPQECHAWGFCPCRLNGRSTTATCDLPSALMRLTLCSPSVPQQMLCTLSTKQRKGGCFCIQCLCPTAFL